jgi:hypothetical protein
VLAKLATRGPINPAKLTRIAQQKTGKPTLLENRISANRFRLTVMSDGTGVDYVELNKTVDDAKPAHLTAEYGLGYTKTAAWNVLVAASGSIDVAYCGTMECGEFPSTT